MPRTQLQFSQTGPHFLKDHEMNPRKLWNLKKYIDLRVWGLETTFGPLGSKRHIKPYVQNNSYNFHKQDLIFSRVMRWIQSNHEISKNLLTLRFRTQKLHLDHLGPENVLNCKSRLLAAIFTNRASFSQKSWDKFSKIRKSQKISWHWALGPRTTFGPLGPRKRIKP